MSKSSTRTSSRTIPKNDIQRKANKSPATGVATTTTPTSSREKLKQQDSLDSERSLRKTTKIAQPTTVKKQTPPLHTSKNKGLDPGPSRQSRTTPSPTTKVTTTSTLRAATKQQKQQQPPATKTKSNAVLDTYHNVTVSSPPSKRKVQPKRAVTDEDKQQQQTRPRTYSRTLQPDEIVVLKRDSAKQRSEVEVKLSKQIQQPVAFEVSFDDEGKKQKQATATETDSYSDDFESYESDFETDASTPEEEEEEEDQVNTEVPEAEPEHSLADKDDDDEVEAEEEEEEDDSEPTQNPITVIHRDKELERKLDSGHYDMNSRRQQRSAAHQSFDSFDTTNSIANSEQLDSGISSYSVAGTQEPLTKSTSDVHYGGYANFVSHPIITRRGKELMRKLRFDQLEYQLFEMKPLSYEGYMQSYGKLNTCQMATQTQAQHMDNECQTLEVHQRTSWTQHPPQYGNQLVLSCSGDAGDDMDMHSDQSGDALECSLARMDQLRRLEQQRTLQQQRQRLAKPNDLERLGVFLHKASLLLGKVLNFNVSAPKRAPMLQTDLLDALRVRRIFGSTGQLVITVHECPPQTNVYRDDFANLLMVWSLTDPSKPLRLLSTWAEVCRVAFCSEAPDIVVAGLRDGSLAMWDLRETYSYCSKLDGNLTHFAATQSVVPSLVSQVGLSALDLGAVVDVRSFRPAPKTAGMALGSSLASTHKDIQYASLNDSGLLTIWTLVESGRGCGGAASTNEYNSPWARVKLLQAASCDLREYLEHRLLTKSQSAYDKTKAMFQGNVYSDELLRELNETQTLTTALAEGEGLQGLRFSNIDTGSDLIYVCSNRNFVLCCTKSLKPERFTRIGLHESRFLFPTALCVLANEHFVAVGLSNGSVMILNCNQRQRQRLQRPITAMPPPTPMVEHQSETGKSCAIQNIILNERRSFEQPDVEQQDVRPNTALALLQQPRRSYELRVFDQQLLLSGSVLRQNLVQALVQSTDGWHLFVVSNGSVRIYDFHLDRERLDVNLDNGARVTDIAASSSSSNYQQLLLLESSGKVQMHSLNL